MFSPAITHRAAASGHPLLRHKKAPRIAATTSPLLCQSRRAVMRSKSETPSIRMRSRRRKGKSQIAEKKAVKLTATQRNMPTPAGGSANGAKKSAKVGLYLKTLLECPGYNG